MTKKELIQSVKEKLDSGKTKQQAFDEIASLKQNRKHEIAIAIRDYPTLQSRKKYLKINNLIIILLSISALLISVIPYFLFKNKTTNDIAGDVLIVLIYILLIYGIKICNKVAISGALFISFVAIFNSFSKIFDEKTDINQIIYLSIIIVISISIMVLCSYLYPKYFSGYNIKQRKDFDKDGESYIVEEYCFTN